MIKKSFLVLFVLLVGYHWVTKEFLLSYDLYLNQNQQNLIKAQEYVFGEKKSKAVILGSSMSNKLEVSIVHGVENIALNGGGVATGLRILELTNHVPDTIFVEITDALQRTVDAPMIEGLQNPFLYPLRKYLPEFRDKNQPLTFIVWRLLLPLNKIFEVKESVSFLHETPTVSQKKVKLPAMPAPSSTDTVTWNQTFQSIKEQLAHYKQKGAVIVLFEMPEDLDLYTDFPYEYVRKWTKLHLPYQFIELGTNEVVKYCTGDRIHLNGESIVRFSHFFNEKVRKATISDR